MDRGNGQLAQTPAVVPARMDAAMPELYPRDANDPASGASHEAQDKEMQIRALKGREMMAKIIPNRFMVLGRAFSARWCFGPF